MGLIIVDASYDVKTHTRKLRTMGTDPAEMFSISAKNKAIRRRISLVI